MNKQYKGVIPACGIYCGTCPLYLRKNNPCKGASGNPERCGKCRSYHQCCKEKGIRHCYACNRFPCARYRKFAINWFRYGQDLAGNQEILRAQGEKGLIKLYTEQPAYRVRFRTERLIIRDTTDSDYALLHQIYTDPEVMRFISSGRYDWTLEEIRNKYAQANTNYTSGYGLFTIQPAGTPAVIGEAGLFNSFDDPMVLELGYILDRRWWGKGYGKEVCRGLIDYCREILRIDKVVARMYAANSASVQLSEAVGMVRTEQGFTPTGSEFYRYEIDFS